jgi:hypothetical protein
MIQKTTKVIYNGIFNLSHNLLRKINYIANLNIQLIPRKDDYEADI